MGSLLAGVDYLAEWDGSAVIPRHQRATNTYHAATCLTVDPPVAGMSKACYGRARLLVTQDLRGHIHVGPRG